MATKTVRSRFQHEVGGKVEGCTILEMRTIIPPDPATKRLGVYDYLVEAPPIPEKAAGPKAKSSRKAALAPERSSFTRATPDEMGSVIRRMPSR